MCVRFRAEGPWTESSPDLSLSNGPQPRAIEPVEFSHADADCVGDGPAPLSVELLLRVELAGVPGAVDKDLDELPVVKKMAAGSPSL